MKKCIFLCALAAFSFSHSQVGINTSTPDKNSIMDMVSSNKGVLIPRINLTSNTLDLNGDSDNNISNQPVGLVIFNTGTSFPKGLYFWSGNEWRNIDNSTVISPSVTSINCLGATLSPKSFTAGVPYTGTVSIPYSGGNGGSYDTGSSFTINNMTFKLQAGKLQSGSGNLVYNVTGTPTNSAPYSMTIPMNSSPNNTLPFLTSSQSCNIIVGNDSSAEVKETAVMGSLSLTSDPLTGYQILATTPDGKYSIRVFAVSGSAVGTGSVQIRPNTTLNSVSWNYHSEWVGNDYVGANNISTFPAGSLGQWCGTGGTGANTQGGNFSIQASSGSVNAWADAGIADGTAIEHRRYTWTNIDPTDKTMYEAIIMMGLNSATGPGVTANTSNCPGGTCSSTKVYIKVTQTSAN